MVTIKDVAEKAGVSISTVSNALTGKRVVSEPLKARVFDAVKELRYVPDAVASNMKRGYTKTIGVIIADITGLFYPYILKGIYEVTDKSGYSITVYDTHTNSGESPLTKEKACLEHLVSNRVDGILLVSSVSKQGKRKYLNKIQNDVNVFKRTPIVSMERDFSVFGIDSVYYDNEKAAHTAVNHLIDCGCTNIVHIAGPRKEELVEGRKRAYIDAMRKHYLTVDEKTMIEYGDYTDESGYCAVCRFIENNQKFDGIFSANDQMGIGALQALKEKSIEVPGKVKLIGMGDVFANELVEPNMSSMHIMKRRLGKRAAAVLLKRIDEISKFGEPKGPVVREEMPVDLVVRESTDPKAIKQRHFTNW